MSDRLSYEVAVVGGGPGGLTTALYTTRLGHRTAVFEREGGRHTAVSHVHNLFGVSKDVSGRQLAEHAVERRGDADSTFVVDADSTFVVDADSTFVVDADHTTVEAERVVLATGFTDADPSVPDLKRFTGRGLHFRLHCDAYTLGDGARAGIAVHEELRRHPCPPDELSDIEELDVPGSSDDIRTRVRIVRERDGHAGPGTGTEPMTGIPSIVRGRRWAPARPVRTVGGRP